MSEEPDTHEEPENCLMLYSGLEDAFIGTGETYGKPPVACYSKRMVLKILREKFQLTPQQSHERYEYEYLQTNFGDATPVFLDDETNTDVS